MRPGAALGGADAEAQAPAAARRRHLRTRELGPCGDVRKHLIERYIGIPVAEAAPNIASVYGRRLRLENQLFLAISQSDERRSRRVGLERQGGGRTDRGDGQCHRRPARLCVRHHLADRCRTGAQRRRQQTFVATLAALLRLTSSWTEDESFGGAIARLPERLSAAANSIGAISRTRSAKRPAWSRSAVGPLAIAREASLKLKETCRLHAEAFSGAEFPMPVALISSRCPVLMFMPTDAAAPGMRQLAAKLRAEGSVARGRAWGCGPGWLPAVPSDHPETDAVCLIQSFYAVLIRLAERLGTDVDRPRHLKRSRAPDERFRPTRGDRRQVFDGSRLHPDCAVVIEGSCIAALLHRSELPSAVPTRVLPAGAWLAPGFIDIQVNGGGDVLFNDSPTPDGIAAIVRAHRNFGTTALLPTLISDTPAKMRAALDAAQQVVPANPSVLGIHLEGPSCRPRSRACTIPRRSDGPRRTMQSNCRLGERA